MTLGDWMADAPVRQLRAAWARGEMGPMFEYKTDSEKEFVKDLAAKTGGRVETKTGWWRMAHILPREK